MFSHETDNHQHLYAEGLKRALNYIVNEQARQHGVSLTQESCEGRFRELVDQLSVDGQQVVILIDEYDKPLLGHLGEPTSKEIQTVLKFFYSVIKTTEAAQHFVLLTGVSKFSQVSVFSDLNNLTDLTMSSKLV